jgi:hypothetical protein
MVDAKHRNGIHPPFIVEVPSYINKRPFRMNHQFSGIFQLAMFFLYKGGYIFEWIGSKGHLRGFDRNRGIFIKYGGSLLQISHQFIPPIAGRCLILAMSGELGDIGSERKT